MRLRALCARCGHEVLWTVTEAGKRQAVDPVPDEAGNTAVYRDGTGTWRSRRPTEELPVMAWERMHIPHVATCKANAPKGKSAELPPGVADLTAYRRKARGRS
jgi:hypothetical protein